MDREPEGHDALYEVGDRKPPTATRFKPGQSGNPKGRPKGSSLKDITQRIANQAVDHKWVRFREFDPALTKLEGVVTRLFERAQAGDVTAIKLALDLARRTESSAVQIAEDKVKSEE